MASGRPGWHFEPNRSDKIETEKERERENLQADQQMCYKVIHNQISVLNDDFLVISLLTVRVLEDIVINCTRVIRRLTHISISSQTVFVISGMHYLDWWNSTFLTVVRLRGPFCISIPNFVQIGQTITEISRFLWFFKMAAAAILDFQKLKILTVDPQPGANMRHRAKFYQNRSNGHRYTAI